MPVMGVLATYSLRGTRLLLTGRTVLTSGSPRQHRRISIPLTLAHSRLLSTKSSPNQASSSAAERLAHRLWITALLRSVQVGALLSRTVKTRLWYKEHLRRLLTSNTFTMGI